MPEVRLGVASHGSVLRRPESSRPRMRPDYFPWVPARSAVCTVTLNKDVGCFAGGRRFEELQPALAIRRSMMDELTPRDAA